jgi:transposase InsO family protein
MSKPLHPMALFRLMVLGPLASRAELKRGEVKTTIRSLAAIRYTIPDSRRTHLSEETIARWYSQWKRGGIEALNPKPRVDKGTTQLSQTLQSRIIALKKDKPSRSINTIISMIEREGLVAKDTLARATVHRFLQHQQLSKRIIPNQETIERRSFVAAHAGDIWQGDVLHGPRIQTPSGMRKTYLVSLIDDSSRLITHSAFCFGETALDIEGVLKSAVLKRGVPYKLIIDNGPAYRSESLQTICAHLEIRLVYCRAGEPEGKGKLERFHRTFREQFLEEIDSDKIRDLGDLNARLWAWIEHVYHTRLHGGLDDKTPIDSWRDDLLHVRPLTPYFANKIDDIFYHRTERVVRKDGTISWEGTMFEVHHNHVGETVTLVFNPHTGQAIRIETVFGDDLGPVVRLDLDANLNRNRQRPHAALAQAPQREHNVEVVYEDYIASIGTLSATNREGS